MTLQNSDSFVVKRSSVNYSVTSEKLVATLQDSDLMVVGRGSTPYKITGKEVKDSLGGGGGGGIFPSENDLTINPSVPGSGTLGDPFILQTRTAAPAGSTVFTSETITFTEQPPDTDVIWTDNSTGSGTRFSQPVTKTDANGTWSAELQYADAPDSTGDINYTGNLQIGVLHFRWQVDQKLNDRIPTQVDSVNLVDTGLENGPRFTDQAFVFTSVITDGAPLPMKTIEAHVDGSIRITPETSDIVATELVFLEQPIDINWDPSYNNNFTLDSSAHTASKDGNAAGCLYALPGIEPVPLTTIVRVAYTVEVISQSYSIVGFGNGGIKATDEYLGQNANSFGFQIWPNQNKISTIGGLAALEGGEWISTDLPLGPNTDGVQVWLDVKPQREFDLYVSGVYMATFTLKADFFTNFIYPAIGTNGAGPETIQVGGPGIKGTKLTLANDSGLSNFAAGDAVVQDSGFGAVTSEIVGVNTTTNDSSQYLGGTETVGNGGFQVGVWDNIFQNPTSDGGVFISIFGDANTFPTGTYDLPVPLIISESVKISCGQNDSNSYLSLRDGSGELGQMMFSGVSQNDVVLQVDSPIEVTQLVLVVGGSAASISGSIYSLEVDGVPFGGELTQLTLADNKDLDAFAAGDLVQQDSSVTGQAPAFSTTTYTGTGAARTVTTGIDLASSDGLVWTKARNQAFSHALYNTISGPQKVLQSQSNLGEQTFSGNGLSSFTSSGFEIGGNQSWSNAANEPYVSWNFRAAPKFFDIQTWTGDGSTAQTIPHSLTTTPGCIILKNTDTGGGGSTQNWFVYHKELPNPSQQLLQLNEAVGVNAAGATYWPSVTDTSFDAVSLIANELNTSYVAYLFADEPGLIKCGSYVGAAGGVVDVGFETQWFMCKSVDTAQNWAILDIERTSIQDGMNLRLNPDQVDARVSITQGVRLSGNRLVFPDTPQSGINSTGETYVYVAIAKDAMADASVTPAGLFQSTDGNTITLTPQTDGWQANQGKKALGPTTTASGTVNVINSSTMTIADSEGTWTPNAGKYVVGPEKIVANARQYLKFDSSGNVTDMQSRAQDPPYTTTATNPSLTLTFPSTFPSGGTPDEELPEGTTLSVGIASENVVNRSPVTGYEEATVQPVSPPSVSDWFATTLYTGNGTTKTITNGIDLAGEGGLVWTKCYDNARSHSLVDTVRGVNLTLASNDDDIERDHGTVSNFYSDGYDAFYNGFSFNTNVVNNNYASWCFRKTPKFFDVVKYTGNGAGHAIPHDLNSVPGMIICKRTDGNSIWTVYHSGLNDIKSYVDLSSNAAVAQGGTGASSLWPWNNIAPTSTDFSVGYGLGPNGNTNYENNIQGAKYIAYLFADEPDLIKCGSYTGTSTSVTVTTGFKPQWLMTKNVSNASDWAIFDSARTTAVALYANGDNADVGLGGVSFTDTGFEINNDFSPTNRPNDNFIYVAIAAPVVETMTAEQFTESQLKFLTYDNRKQVKEGEDALNSRAQVIAEADIQIKQALGK